MAEVVYIENEVIFFAEVVVFLSAAGEGEFSGVFGVGWAEDQGVFWVSFLDQEGDEFAGAVSGEDEFGRDAAVFGDGVAESCIVSVRVGGQDVQMAGELFFYVFRKSQRVYIGTEFHNIFLIQMINFAYFFNIASVKDHFCSWHMTFLISV